MQALERFLIDPEPLTPELLGLTTVRALEERIELYMEVAGITSAAEPTEAQRSHVLALIYGARIVVLEGEVEKFRAEGQLSVERDLKSRISRLDAARTQAWIRATAGGTAADDGFFGPIVDGWGVL